MKTFGKECDSVLTVLGRLSEGATCDDGDVMKTTFELSILCIAVSSE
jgi:hypothetical protein